MQNADSLGRHGFPLFYQSLDPDFRFCHRCKALEVDKRMDVTFEKYTELKTNP